MWIKICGITRLEDAISPRSAADAVASSLPTARGACVRRLQGGYQGRCRGPFQGRGFVDSPPDLVRASSSTVSSTSFSSTAPKTRAIARRLVNWPSRRSGSRTGAISFGSRLQLSRPSSRRYYTGATGKEP